MKINGEKNNEETEKKRRISPNQQGKMEYIRDHSNN